MCPPGVDQTERSPPTWTLLAPTLQQQQALPGRDTKDKLWWFDQPSPFEFLRAGKDFNAFGKLARVAAPASTRPALPAFLANAMSNAASSRLEMLATELVDIITAELTVDEQMALALCSTTLWCHVLYQVHAAYSQGQGPWAATPIICTSTYLLDLPEALQSIVPAKARSRSIAPARSWNWGALSTFNKLENLPSIEAEYHAAFDRHAAASAIPQHIQEALKPALKKVSLERKYWMLRNLDTREIVRFEATAANESTGVHTNVAGCPWLTLDFVLITRICWTRLPYHYDGRRVLPATERMERGVWAGNCFDVVEDVEETADLEGWRDVTQEVKAEAKLIKEELS